MVKPLVSSENGASINTETEREAKLKYLRTDNGIEFQSKEFSDFCKEKRIKTQYSEAYTSAKWISRNNEYNLTRESKVYVAECKVT